MPKPTAALKSQAAWLAALGQPTRLTIVRILAAGELTVGALAAATGVEAVNVSSHLAVLRVAGVVRASRTAGMCGTVWPARL